MKEFLKTPGVDLAIEFYGVQIAVVKDAPTIPIPPSNKLTYSIDANGLHFPGIDGTNPILITNDFAADSPEVPLLFLAADKGKVNLAGIVMHATLDPDPRWNFETTQKHWANVMSQVTGLKNIPAPVKGSTKKLVKPTDGNIDSTIPEPSAGADLIIAKAKLCTAAKPLVIFMGGQSPDVANAYLKDKSIADKIVLFHINGYWDGGTDGYNTADPWATYILIKRMKYVSVNVKFPEAGKYWYAGKNLGLSQSIIDSVPAHPTTTMLKNWFANFFKNEGLADAPAVLWFFNNKLWKNAVKKRENGTITTGDDYDFIFITEHDWPAYGATLVGKMKEWIGNVVVDPSPIIEFPPGTGISSGFQDALNSAGQDKPVVIAKSSTPYKSVPNLTLKPGASLIGFEPGGVVIEPATKKGYEAGKDNSDAWLRVASTSRVMGAQKIANLKIVGAGAQGGIFIENRDNVSVENIEIGTCSFMGFWARNCKGLRVNGMRLYDNSWCTTGAGGWASGEFCYVELDDFIINDVFVSSTSKARGYGFKALWGEYEQAGVKKYRNMYNGKFTKLRTAMNHESNWDNGRSHNIGFEMHNVHVKGDVSIEDSDIGNQVSLHQPDATNSTGKFRYTGNRHNGGNDRYAIEYIMNNLEVDHNIFENTSQFLFNGQTNIKVKNGNIHDNNYNQGSAPNTGWGGVFLFGQLGAENVNIRSNTIRKRSDNALLKFQNVQGGVNTDIETANTITNF